MAVEGIQYRKGELLRDINAENNNAENNNQGNKSMVNIKITGMGNDDTTEILESERKPS